MFEKFIKPSRLSPSFLLYIATLVACTVLFALFKLQVFGTVPSDVDTLRGKHTIVMPSGEVLLSLDVDEDDYATVTYRGIQMKGRFVRSRANQDSTIFSLAEMYFCTISNPKYLGFSLEAPVTGFSDGIEGTWRMTLRNRKAANNNGDTSMAEALFLDKRDKEVEDATFEWFTKDEPYELFDWVTFEEGGTARSLSKTFIVESSSNDDLAAAAHPLAWWESERGIYRLEEPA